MISKLTDRLIRLEGSRIARNGSGVLPPELMRAWIRAIAIGLGGYPQGQQTASPYWEDSYSDGFARGLSYANRDDMLTSFEADPDQWQRRIDKAHDDLCRRYRVDGSPFPEQDTLQLWVAALDEWSNAKASNPDWPPNDDSDCLACALSFYGAKAEHLEEVQ